MFAAVTLVVGLLQLVGVWSSSCVDDRQSENKRSWSIDNCCNLGFRYSVFSEKTNRPGVYRITNFCGNCRSSLTRVFCDTDTDGGGWTVIQRRQNGNVEFEQRYWVEYEQGFGDLSGEFWYGLRSIHCLTKDKRWELRVDFTFSNGTKSHLSYDYFRVESELSQYRLNVQKFKSIGLTNPLDSANGKSFTSRDYDNDLHSGINCADKLGGWWHNSCGHLRLNGQYNYAYTMYLNGNWHALQFVEMKIRPVNCYIFRDQFLPRYCKNPFCY